MELPFRESRARGARSLWLVLVLWGCLSCAEAPEPPARAAPEATLPEVTSSPDATSASEPVPEDEAGSDDFDRIEIDLETLR